MNHSDFDPIHQNHNIESKIVASLERISQAFRVLLWRESKEFSLSPIQVQVLIFLLHHSDEKRKVSYLAQEFNMTKATISDTIKTLEQKALVSKHYLADDSRSYIINLTDAGSDIALETSYFTRQIKAPIDKLSPEEKESLLQSLFSIIKHLNRSEVITVQRMCVSCAYFDSAQSHCMLINQKLQVADLKLDCPDHEVQV